MSKVILATAACIALAWPAIEISTADTERMAGNVTAHGALRSIFHEGKTGAVVELSSMLPDENLYAVGALEGLSGEITVVAGNVYLSYVEGDTTRTEVATRTEAAATLLVAAKVPAWRSTVTKRPIRFGDIDEEVARLASEAGMNLAGRFAFILEGHFEDLQWHVIDGTRLEGGATSHEDHLEAAVRSQRDRAHATLVGFYSESDQGVFTHMGSRTHIHCVLGDPPSTGHVDHVIVPAGTTVRFPDTGSRYPD